MQTLIEKFSFFFNHIAYLSNSKVKYITKHPTSAEVGCLVICKINRYEICLW